MKKLRIQSAMLLTMIALIGNLQAMSPAMKWEETEQFQEELARREEQGKAFGQKMRNITNQLGLELPQSLDEDVDPIVIPLTRLHGSGLDEDQIVSLIESWRATGHQFPDKRFDDYSVANALMKYAQDNGYSPSPYVIIPEDSYSIGEQDYPESTIYAMTPEEREKLLLAITKDTSEADLNLIKKLIGWVANVNAQDNNGGTALIHAAYNNNTEAIRALLDAGADVNAQDNDGWTALMAAAMENHTEAIRALLDAGADVNAQDLNGRTALMHAAYNKATEAIRALLAAGAKVNAQDNDDRTALIVAAFLNHTEAISALLAADADVNAQTNDGYTALIWAAYKNHTDAIRALLEAGAEVNAKDNDGDSALSAAQRRGNTQVADLLREHGATEEN